MSNLYNKPSLIVPETGVTVMEGGKSKSGDKDFFHKYHKYSKYDYLTMLKDSSSMTSIYQTRKGNLSMDMSMGIGDRSNSDIHLSLPLINNGKIPTDNSNPSHNLSLNYNYNNYNNVAGSSFSNNKKRLSYSMYHGQDIKSSDADGRIKLSNKMTMSLKSTLDALDLIPEYEEKIDELNNNAINILRNRRNYISSMDDTSNKDGMEEINKFNLSIIKNNQWGNYNGPKKQFFDYLKSPVKPNKREIERELGKFNL
jgi:hypothetical protein